ncbi:MAG: hypothetical protein HZT40_02190 [Candidatus Thiothrix singaporensis]|uniref:Uncharacterized protein n=1 Tax=Candidatus Thiothrix singaporensis TaxID=2799669 RepID=A0A7L6ANE4_9GAMM|nr:MAG: hypothetical protein HZT40_02190 [Candidatus Thiothrix singaporensis]
MSATITDMNKEINRQMGAVSTQLDISQHHLQTMSRTMASLQEHTTDIGIHMQDMAGNVQQMDTTTQHLAGSVYNLQYGITRINHIPHLP